MQTDSSLLKIAQAYEPNIKRVGYENIKGDGLGFAYKIPLTGEYVISIADKVQCGLFRLFIFYHELGHIVLYHLGYKRWKGKSLDREEAADMWAFERLGMMDNENRACRGCMSLRSLKCGKATHEHSG